MSETAPGTGLTHMHYGRCPICDCPVRFIAAGPYLRNTLRCEKCDSVPRNRALMHVLETHFPAWRSLAIHEGSPGTDSLSRKLFTECPGYTGSHYDRAVPFGSIVPAPHLPCQRYRSEDLENQTFNANTFDLVITQDVFEHLFHPGRAMAEIARTLRPGGATIMTVPIVRKNNPSSRRASMLDGVVTHFEPQEYHGNPIDNDGSLVTIAWGYDVVSYLQSHSGLSFMMVLIDDMELGIRADLNEVLIGFKIPPNLL